MRVLKIAIPCAVLLSGYASLATQGSSDVATPGIEPGQWEMVTEITAIEVPGAPEEILQQMQSSLAEQRHVDSQCITPEEARNPSANMMGSQNPAGCEFGDTTWSGGAIRIRATCRPSGQSMQMAIDGTYAVRQIDSRIDVNMDIAGSSEAEAPLHVRLLGRMTGRRTGECATPDPRANENSLPPAN
jgi:hypothetical protein